jgi:predicted kinase
VVATRKIVLSGPPCSGKSTIAAWLASILPGIHVEVDALLTAILPGSDRRLEHRLLAYEIAAFAASALLARGFAPILDCTYTRQQARRYLIEHSKPNDRLIVVEFAVSPAAAVERFNHRPAHAATDLSPEAVRHQAASYPYGCGSVLVNSESNPDDIRASVIQAIQGDGGDFDPDPWVRAGL